MVRKCSHEWLDDSEGLVICFFCGREGPPSNLNIKTHCIECGSMYGGVGGQGLCPKCSVSLGMHEEEL